MDEWFEDESFWIEMFSYMFTEERMSSADEQVEKLLALVGFQTGTVLDLCCGPGRHSIALARRGIQVTAVDRTKFLWNRAREAAAESNLEIEFILEDMRNFIRPGAFDLVINMFTSFGYFDNKDEDLKVLHNIYESLKPGGSFLIDIMGKEILVKTFLTTTFRRQEDGALIVEIHEIFDEWSRIRNEWFLIKGERVRSFKFHHTLYSGQELKYLMYRAGFNEVRLYGDLDGNEYGLDAKRLIAVGKKSG
jgi:SAM-dependent methyltransferase